MRDKNRTFFRDRYSFLLPSVSFSCPDAWFGIVQDLLESFQTLIAQKIDIAFRVEDIYEKYATLRVDHNGGDEYDTLVLAAEARSEHTCSICASSEGVMRDTND